MPGNKNSDIGTSFPADSIMAFLFAFLGPFHTIFAVTGTLAVLAFVLKTLYYIGKNIFVYYLAAPLGLTVDFKKLGQWAVVTGATDGIGKGYAFDLARRGCNVVLISRTQEKLDSVAKEIEARYPKIQTKTIAIDFTQDESVYDKIREELRDLEVGTLVNNVGMSQQCPEYFDKVPGGEEFLLQLIRCNCIAQTMMTKIVLPGMVKRGKGAVISLSSLAGNYALPLLAPYSASKAFNDYLGRSLALEYSGKGVIFQVIQPVLVATNMSGVRRTSFFVLDPKAYARSCLNAVGWLTKTNGHPVHAVQNWVVAHLPMGLLSGVLRNIMVNWRNKDVAKLKKRGTWKGE